LPGVGPATAKKIVENRPYARKDELVDKKIVSPATYDKIKGQIVARSGEKAEDKNSRGATAGKREKPSSDRDGASSDVRSTKTRTQEAQAKNTASREKVWVNTGSGVYHHEGDVWYGKTKEGKYMTEAEAVRAGYRESKQAPAQR
jgi:hypothetical protein